MVWPPLANHFYFDFNRYRSLLVVAICSLFIFGLTYFATVEVKNSDYTHSLLVSQAILEHHTVQLDAYKDRVDLAHHFDYNYRIEQINGHYYYPYPLGPSVLLIPVVGIARLMGLDMAIHDQEYTLLKLMGAVTTTVVFIIIYALGRCYLNPPASLVIALFSVLGSTLISTMGVGLWNMNFTILFYMLSLWHLARYDSASASRRGPVGDNGQIKMINPYWLGLLLFLAYWSRPTAAIFVVLVFGYILLEQKTVFLKLIITAGILFLFSVFINWFEYGRFFLDYYMPSYSEFTSKTTFGQALYALSFGPARGVFVFNPFIIGVVGLALWYYQAIRRNSLFWLCIIWFVLHFIMIARFVYWWGGHSYGPRLLIDIIPAMILITALLWREITYHAVLRARQVIAIGYLILGGIGIFINSYQGLYNPSAYRWNKDPNIDQYLEYLFDWKYPQFLASEESLRQRRLEHQQARIGPYPLGDALTFDSQAAVFVSWSEPETGWRWTQGPSAQLIFRLDEHIVDPDRQYTVEILGASLKSQEVGVALNGVKLGNLKLAAFTGAIPQPQILNFSGDLLVDGGLNQIRFDLPGVTEKKSVEVHTSGMAFVSLKLYPFLQNTKGVDYFDSDAFETGFSHAEKDWRWTDGTEAVINYPFKSVEIGQDSGGDYVMELTCSALGRQDIEVRLNGTSIGSLTVTESTPKTYTLSFKGDLLRVNDNNKIQLYIPGAMIPAGDSRRLGLAFVSLHLSHHE